VTVHVADESGGKTYVADGITRLDAMEALDWQIVERNNNESTDSIQKKRILLVLIAPALVAVERLPGASPDLLSAG